MDRDDAGQIRLRFIAVPLAGRGLSSLCVLAVGLLFTYVLGYLVVLCLIMLSGSEGLSPTTRAYITALVAGLVGPISFVWAYAKFRQRARGIRAKRRLARLRNFSQDERSRERIPHRAVEYRLYRSGRSAIHNVKQLNWLQANQVFVLGEEFAHAQYLRIPLNMSFEPLFLLAADDSLVELIAASNVDMKGEVPKDSDEKNEQLFTLRRAGSWSILLFCFFSIAFGAYRILSRSDWLICFSIGFAVLFVGALRVAVIRRHWWLIPGGLIFREDAAWRRGVRVSIFRTENSALIVDWRANQGCVIQNSIRRNFTFSDEMATLIPAGWIGSARSPTDAEIHSLFGSAER